MLDEPMIDIPFDPTVEPIEERSVRFLQSVIDRHGHGEARPQQVQMVEMVSRGIEDSEHILIQAGTGVGKTYGYLVPLICSGKRGIVSTATKQLSEQVFLNDLPLLNKVSLDILNVPLNFAILKGRSNYICQRKVAEVLNLDDRSSSDPGQIGLPGLDIPTSKTTKRRGDEMTKIISWAGKRGINGDRSNAPTVSDEIWRSVSAVNSECPGRQACPFGATCFSEIAREQARTAKIVVTNHALVGMDMASGNGALLGQRDVVVFDEVHEIDGYLSSAWGATLTVKDVENAVKISKRAIATNMLSQRNDLDELSKLSERLEVALELVEDGLFHSWDDELSLILSTICSDSSRLFAFLSSQFDDDNNNESEKVRFRIAMNVMRDIFGATTLLITNRPDIVKWIATEDGTKTLFAEPLRIGPMLMQKLYESDMTMIGTSATITVGGDFEIPVRNLALDERISYGLSTGSEIILEESLPRKFHALDVGTPFNYPKQGILYIPTSETFPAPIGKERFEHTEAVLNFLVKAVKAAGGRTLALSTTAIGARRMAERLREEVDTTVLSQWDAAPGVIAQEWINDETATLCATMGMWHGLNPMGATCSLVIMDKIPFAPMNNPLMTARVEDVNARGGNGFMDVYVAAANVLLAQGAGRLIRHTKDRGVVAILDTRLREKRYGAVMLRSLPPMWRTDSEEDTLVILNRLVSLSEQ